MVAEQRADLVAAQHPPAVRAGYGHGAPVRVGVVGHHQVGADLDGERHREVHRARLLGVGEGDRREVGVGLPCCVDDVRRGEAGRLEHLEHRRAADAVQRRVDDAQVARPVAGEVGDGVEVAVDDVLAEHLAGARRAGTSASRADRRDPLGDLGVGRRHDLAAVAEVDLVAVVLRRVVAGGHHHARDAAELADRERQQRGRQRPRQHERARSPRRSSPRRCRARRRRSCGGRRSRSPRRRRRRPASRRYAASPAAARITTTRFIRLGPAPSAPRSPAVPNSRVPANRSREVGGVAARLARRSAASSSARVCVVGVLGGPGAGAVEQVDVWSHARTVAPLAR